MKFFCHIWQTQMDLLDTFRAESLKSNQSIWFGHYTTSTIVSPSSGVRDMMRQEQSPILNLFFLPIFILRVNWGNETFFPSRHGANIQQPPPFGCKLKLCLSLRMIKNKSKKHFDWLHVSNSCCGVKYRTSSTASVCRHLTSLTKISTFLC